MSTQKKPTPQHVLGIDFGTSNSYFSDVLVRGGNPSYTDLKFHNGQSSVPTCVLYRKEGDKWIPHSFGESAVDLWKELTEEERKDYSFRGGFKPDLSFREEAFQDSVAFFRVVRNYLVENKIVLHFSPEEGRQVVVGVPAENVAGQKEKTLLALQEAGIYNAELLPEPEGALFYHLFYDSEQITLKMAHQGVLVVDFGGGTFDLAFLSEGEVQKHWGNPMLGGRLFDDLFFQWFLEMSGGASTLQEMKEDGNLDFLRTFAFRRLKERFSSAWSNQQVERFRERMTMGVDYDYGVFRNASLAEFYKRCEDYSPSSELLEDLVLLHDPSVEPLRKGHVHLLDAIRVELNRLGDSIPLEDVKAVILTGGSSRWPFMEELVREFFPEVVLFQSADPEATISRGLGLAFSFRELAKSIRDRLQGNLTELKNDVFDIVRKSYETFATRVTQNFTTKLFVEQIRPLFEEWRDKGGTIEELEKKAENVGKQYFELQGESLIQSEQQWLEEHLKESIHAKLRYWLQKNHILHTEYLKMDRFSDEEHAKIRVSTRLNSVMDGFFSAVGLLITTLVSLVIGSITGGTGLALITTGPLGILIGVVLGVIASAFVISNVNKKQIHLPSWLLKKAANDQKLEEAQRHFSIEIERKILEIFDEKEEQLRENLHQQVQSLMDDVSDTMPVTAIIQ